MLPAVAVLSRDLIDNALVGIVTDLEDILRHVELGEDAEYG